ncbi:hypothetical protein KBD34_02405 [Patescibacteria group bacterium]|nr:hypothetical protein [Patescibacteria group bacterium]
MTKTRLLVSALLVAGVLFSSQSNMAAAAASEGEESILAFLRDTVVVRLTQLSESLRGFRGETQGRFDGMDAKLDRIYAACNRTPAPSRRVTAAQVNTCINSCFTATAIETEGGGAVDGNRFVACVSRCPSNTSRNQECAQRYARATEALYLGVPISFETYSHTAAGFARVCLRDREARYADMCRLYADTLLSGLSSCLLDQQAQTCQQDCDGNFRNIEGHTICLLRCNNRTRSTEIYNGLQESGFLDDAGQLSVGTLNTTDLGAALNPTELQNLRAQPTEPIITNNPVPQPTPETYSACVYRCDAERSSCLVQLPTQPQNCQTTYDTCYSACSARRVNGSAQ